MKIKIEVDCTPEEVQELFVPGEKQQEFLTAIGKAYADAAAKAGVELASKFAEEPMRWLRG